MAPNIHLKLGKNIDEPQILKLADELGEDADELMKLAAPIGIPGSKSHGVAETQHLPTFEILLLLAQCSSLPCSAGLPWPSRAVVANMWPWHRIP